jgi:hypothetical protein
MKIWQNDVAGLGNQILCKAVRRRLYPATTRTFMRYGRVSEMVFLHQPFASNQRFAAFQANAVAVQSALCLADVK